MSAFSSDFVVVVVSFFRRCKKKKTIRTTMEGFVGGWMGGVALIKFPGGFDLLEPYDFRLILVVCFMCYESFLYLDVPTFC